MHMLIICSPSSMLILPPTRFGHYFVSPWFSGYKKGLENCFPIPKLFTSHADQNIPRLCWDMCSNLIKIRGYINTAKIQDQKDKAKYTGINPGGFVNSFIYNFCKCFRL